MASTPPVGGTPGPPPCSPSISPDVPPRSPSASLSADRTRLPTAAPPPSTSPLSSRSLLKPSCSSKDTIPQVHSPLAITPAKSADNGPRSALFDDHVATAHVPGSLHLAPDSTIERLVERQGYVSLIRQLAEDLAHRDRELVNFRRRAEERERALRRMLVEVEISNSDIEKRLTAATLQKKASKETMKSDRDGMSYTESIDELMQQAMSEEDAFSVQGEGLNGESAEEEDVFVAKARDTDEVSVMSNASNASRRSSTMRGWGRLFWGSGKSNAEGEETVKERRLTVPTNARKLTADTFKPLEEAGPPRSASRSSIASSRSAVRSASAQLQGNAGRVPAPILAQNNLDGNISQSPQEYDNIFQSIPPTSPSRPRSQSIPDATASAHQRRPSSGNIENLQKVSARNVVQRQQGRTRSRAPSTSAASSQPAKSSKFFQEIKETAGRIVPLGGDSSQASGAAKPQDAGPVEMDMIIPHEVQPPTLLQSWNQYYPTDYLTDRFGFIYDKRRESVTLQGVVSIRGTFTERKTPEETASKADGSSTGSPNMKKTVQRSETSETAVPTKLQDMVDDGKPPALDPSSQPQSPVPMTKTMSEPGAKPESVSTLLERLSRPGASVTSTTTALPEAPLTIQSPVLANGSKSSAEEATVRLLLGQLSDIHDSLQRDRTLKWNEFLRKLQQERRRGNDEERETPEAGMAEGEVIGVATLGNEGRGGKQRWKEFKQLVLGGIPVKRRATIWTECSGATSMKVPGYYDDLLQNHSLDDPLVISQIAMDINRTLTDNIFFRQGPGVSKLRQVLLAYSRRNKDVGYCQGMNMIAASLLLIMPSEEDAFWVLCSIVERILPKTYFEPSLLASRADQQVLKHYVALILPALHNHLAELGVELEALTFQWFLSMFTDTLAAEALFRVWDVILCFAGSVFLFRVAIALLRLNERDLLQCKTAAEVYSYLNGGMIHQGISIDGLIHEADALKGLIRVKDVEIRREVAVKKELKERGEAGSEQSPPDAVDDAPQLPAATTEDQEELEVPPALLANPQETISPSPPLPVTPTANTTQGLEELQKRTEALAGTGEKS